MVCQGIGGCPSLQQACSRISSWAREVGSGTGGSAVLLAGVAPRSRRQAEQRRAQFMPMLRPHAVAARVWSPAYENRAPAHLLLLRPADQRPQVGRDTVPKSLMSGDGRALKGSSLPEKPRLNARQVVNKICCPWTFRSRVDLPQLNSPRLGGRVLSVAQFYEVQARQGNAATFTRSYGATGETGQVAESWCC